MTSKIDKWIAEQSIDLVESGHSSRAIVPLALQSGYLKAIQMLREYVESKPGKVWNLAEDNGFTLAIEILQLATVDFNEENKK